VKLDTGDAFVFHEAGFGVIEILNPQRGAAVVRMQNGALGEMPIGMAAVLVANMPFVDECLQREVTVAAVIPTAM